jgi:hypothetical protein
MIDNDLSAHLDQLDENLSLTKVNDASFAKHRAAWGWADGPTTETPAAPPFWFMGLFGLLGGVFAAVLLSDRLISIWIR